MASFSSIKDAVMTGNSSHYSRKGVLIPGSYKHRLSSTSRNSRIPFLPPKFRCFFSLLKKRKLSFFGLAPFFFVKKHSFMFKISDQKVEKIKCFFFKLNNVFASIKHFPKTFFGARTGTLVQTNCEQSSIC